MLVIKYFQAIKSRGMRRAGHVARMGRGEVHTGFYMEWHDGRESLGRPRRRWQNNIKVSFIEVV